MTSELDMKGVVTPYNQCAGCGRWLLEITKRAGGYAGRRRPYCATVFSRIRDVDGEGPPYKYTNPQRGREPLASLGGAVIGIWEYALICSAPCLHACVRDWPRNPNNVWNEASTKIDDEILKTSWGAGFPPASPSDMWIDMTPNGPVAGDPDPESLS